MHLCSWGIWAPGRCTSQWGAPVSTYYRPGGPTSLRGMVSMSMPAPQGIGYEGFNLGPPDRETGPHDRETCPYHFLEVLGCRTHKCEAQESGSHLAVMLGVMGLDGRGRGNLMGSLFPQSPDNHRLEVVIVNQGNLCLGTIEVAYC